jgi:hypothetical protein
MYVAAIKIWRLKLEARDKRHLKCPVMFSRFNQVRAVEKFGVICPQEINKICREILSSLKAKGKDERKDIAAKITAMFFRLHVTSD